MRLPAWHSCWGSLSLFGIERQASAQEPGLQAGITATVNSAVAAFNRGDFGAFISHFSDKGFQDMFGQTKAEAAADPEFFGDQVIVKTIRNVSGSGNSATAVIEFAIGLGIEADLWTFALVDGRWRVEASAPTSAAVPAGARVTEMRLQEYAFVYDKAAMASGNVAFNVSNTGKEEHELVVLKVPEAFTIAAFLEAVSSEEESEGPPPFEDFGFLGIYAPGAARTAAFSQTLESGKYFFVCFLPAPDGLPHVAKGMISEFTVGTGTSTGGTVRPPSTGDGGMAAGDNSAGAVY